MSPDRPCVAAPVPKRPACRRLAAIAIPAILAGALLLPAAARAQALKPWVPPSADSLQRWASEARVRFQENTGDSVGGANFRAYELVGTMGRRLVRSLGRANLLQAQAVATVIDSLGLDVDVQVDPRFPQFVLLVVRNPYRLTAHAVGFLYWYRGDDLRMQGAMFYGGHRPAMRVWWTGYRDQPYSLGVIDHDRSPQGRVRMTLFRMGPSAAYWDMLQYPEEGPDLGGAGEAAWVDINRDDRPELVAWVRAQNDTLFDACVNCPFIIHEMTYTESKDGLRLHDMRVLPSPYATFTLFVRLLGEGNRAAAARLLRDPAKVGEAMAAGWGERRRAKAWMLEYAEEERWPRWLAFIHHGPRGDQRYIVHFELKEGRWIIREWLKPRRPTPPGLIG
ncbi:MAG: hypothetical protein AAB113_01255, partial [Candidatus Eisenbacteria bacterium]